MPPDLFAATTLRMGEHALAYARRYRDDWAALRQRQDHLLQAVELCAGLSRDVTGAGATAGRILVESAQALGPYMLRHGSPAAWQPYLETAVQAAGDLGDCVAQAELHNQMGQQKSLQDDYGSALSLHRQAAATFRRLDEALNLARSLRLQGNIHYHRNDRPAALVCYEGARDLLAGLDEPIELSHVYHNMANVHLNNRDWAQALLHYERALALLDAKGDHAAVTRLRNNLALLRWEQGQWRQAVEDLLCVLPLQEEAGDRAGLANAHHYLCVTYTDLETWEKALFHGRRALALRQALGSDEGLADLYTDLATLYSRLADREAAEAFLAQAWPLWQSLDRPGGLARLRLIRGDLHGQAGEWSQARDAFQEALTLLEPLSDLPRRLLAMVGLARAYGKGGNTAAGLAWLPRIGDLIDELARPDYRVQALWLRAELSPASAHELLGEAVALCGVPDNDRFDWLRRQTEARLAALGAPEIGRP
jgi:tetratricopeptide (TPR) repeat protein